MNSDEITVHATVSCAAWMVGHGLEEQACKMRDEFLETWGFHPVLWNRECDQLIDFARRQDAAVSDFEAVRIEFIEA